MRPMAKHSLAIQVTIQGSVLLTVIYMFTKFCQYVKYTFRAYLDSPLFILQ